MIKRFVNTAIIKPSATGMNKEELKIYLINNLSKEATVRATENLRDNKEVFQWLWEIILENRQPESWRASWIFEHIANLNKNMAFPYLSRMIQALPDFNHNGQKRHILKVIRLFEVPESQKIHLLNICFDFLMSKTEPVAVKMQSINILYDISLSIPEIKPELRSSIEYNLPDATSGFINSATKILKKLKNNKI